MNICTFLQKVTYLESPYASTDLLTPFFSSIHVVAFFRLDF